MTTLLTAPARPGAAAEPGRRVGRLGGFSPNWFAVVMGTGIVANAAVSLPVQIAGQTGFAVAVWLLAASLLVALLAATVAQWARWPRQARAQLSDPVMAHFYGAPAMALLTVGAGALLAGKHVIGLRTAVDLDWTLWIAGTGLGVLAAVVVPYVLFTRLAPPPDGAFGGWLMPVVPPMVSASTGALLVPQLGSVNGRETLLLGCYAMFGLSLVASLIVITLIWGRLARHKVGAVVAVPTLWIVLGPFGQSITAVNLLGTASQSALAAPYAQGAAVLGLFYGVAAWGFAALWLLIATAITVRAARQRLPFSLGWWSFTFPVGTFVTGTSALAARTGLGLFVGSAAALYLVLLVAWATVFGRTVRAVRRGELLPATAAFAA